MFSHSIRLLNLIMSTFCLKKIRLESLRRNDSRPLEAEMTLMLQQVKKIRFISVFEFFFFPVFSSEVNSSAFILSGQDK